MMEYDELYVVARRVLLDALDALGAHRDAVVLVGAQAVYLRVGEADLAVAAFTTDGDLVIDPARLGEIPPLERALASAGFQPRSHDSVGIWVASQPTSHGKAVEVPVDLLVPAAVSPGKGRRAARLPGHDPRVARIVEGLEGSVVDADVMRIASLDVADGRSFEIRVAGPAALLVSKLHKIVDRSGTDRASDKDALDVVRLLRGTQTGDLAARFGQLLADARSAAAANRAQELLPVLFGTRSAAGVTMAIRSVQPLDLGADIGPSCELLVADLLAALRAP